MHRSEVRVRRIPSSPPPRCKKFATCHELGGKALAELLAFRSIPAQRPPTAQSLALSLICKSSTPTDATNICGRPLKVVKTRCGNVKVRLTCSTAVGPRGASVFLHHDCGPIRVHRIGVLHQQALPATATVVVNAATRVVFTQHGGERIRCGASEPHLLPVHRTAKGDWILRAIPWGRHVLAFIPGLENGGVATLTAAIPIMCHFQFAFIPHARSCRRWCGR